MTAMIAQPVCLRPFAAAVRGSQAAQGRSLSLVVRAQAPKAGGIRAAVKAVREAELPAGLKPAALVALANAVAALPAHAEAGKIFDFNLTLPIMTAQFLLLMVFLDKAWFTPVGKVLDERDGYIREQLQKFKGNDEEILAKQAEAEKALQEARAAAQAAIQGAKAAAQDKQAARLGDVKAKIDKELAAALATLEKEKEAALSDLDSQVEKLSAEILARVLPEGVKL